MTASNQALAKIINETFGFPDIQSAKSFLIANTKNEYGADYCEIKIGGLTMFYSSNCKNKFQIGGNVKGIYQSKSF